MTEELRPGVAELLHAKHGAAPATRAAAPDPQDTEQLLQIATGAMLPEYRTKALGVLGDRVEAADVFRQALDDHGAADTVRAAGATLLSRDGADGADDALITALAEESSEAVRHKIVTGLARVGGDAAYQALGEVAARDGALAEHARFARTLIGYRIGAPTDPIVIAPAQLAPAAAIGDAIWAAGADSLTAEIVSDLAPDSYGVALAGADISTVDCDGTRWVIALSIPDQRDRPAVAGLIALQSPVDGSFSTSSVILWRPKDKGRVEVSAHRLDGRPEYAGEATADLESVTFTLDAVRGPGAVEKTIEGHLDAGRLSALTIRSGARLASRNPVPI